MWGKNGRKRGIFPSSRPPPLFLFQPNIHSLGNLFFSPQASSEIETKMALAWLARQQKYALARQNINTPALQVIVAGVRFSVGLIMVVL